MFDVFHKYRAKDDSCLLFLKQLIVVGQRDDVKGVPRDGHSDKEYLYTVL